MTDLFIDLKIASPNFLYKILVFQNLKKDLTVFLHFIDRKCSIIRTIFLSILSQYNEEMIGHPH